MARNFKEAIKSRRTYYGFVNKSPITDDAIKELIEFAVTHTPSAFNSQSTRVVLLLGENHKKLWNITKEILKAKLPEDAFKTTEAKINNLFASGYGTILFYEDMSVIENLQKTYPGYKDNFPIWSYQTSGMHQFAIWTLLEDAGLGASLQHYNPLIDDAVAKEWNINPKWKLIAEMPFGEPTNQPGKKEYLPLNERVFVYK
ncbi:nitroreductase family protein [Parabacteroides bouchesdurhonensis]|uniref:nitroreductase family protein n=1 Tax=Parabacteroides bouchesdurhonensis TaxID=1936995 RepID=UPI000C83895B|nr:nitroreductase family protein [Parabacteroides bouchesdurhonensis]